MSKSFGCQSMVDPLRRVLVRRPDEAFGSADPERWHYAGRPDLEKARTEHDALVEILRDAGVEVVYHNGPANGSADAIFTHDPCIVTDEGAILLKMGKPLRDGEPEAMEPVLKALGIPIYRKLHGEARAEGGDLLWIDRRTLAVGQGQRTNAEGLRQLREALEPLGVHVLPVPLPAIEDPEACLHLMSLVSLVDHELAVIDPLLPDSFKRVLDDRGFGFVEAPEQELGTLATNILALAPRSCVMLDGNPVTRQRLEAAACRVDAYEGNEISFKTEGGITCLTRPLLRA